MSPDTNDGPQSPQSDAPASPPGPQSPGAGAQAPPPPPPGGGLAAPSQNPAAFAAPPAGAPQLSSVGKRFGEYLLEIVLSIVTLGIGWLIWALIVFGRGQTPAKQVLGMRVVDAQTGLAAGWGKTFVREILAKFVIGLVAPFTLYIILFWLAWDDRNQQLWDKMVGTVVVDDPDGRLAPG